MKIIESMISSDYIHIFRKVLSMTFYEIQSNFLNLLQFHKVRPIKGNAAITGFLTIQLTNIKGHNL